MKLLRLGGTLSLPRRAASPLTLPRPRTILSR